MATVASTPATGGAVPPSSAPPSAPQRWRPSVRLHLVLLALTALLPLWMLAGSAAWQMAETQRAAVVNEARDAVNNLAFVLDREMVGLRGALTALGSSPALRAGDYATFHAQALALRDIDGSQIRLTDPAGQVLVDTDLPFGAPDAVPVPNPPPAQHDVLSGTLSPMLPGSAHRVALTLEIPGPPGQDSLFLSIGTDPLRLWLASLQRAALPPGWVAVIADAEGRIVAREPYQQQRIGIQLPPESVARQALASGQVSGFTGARQQDMEDAYVAWHRVGASPWIVAVRMPGAGPDGALTRALVPVVLLGGALLLLFTAGLTLWADRRIAAPLARLGRLAEAFGRGGPLPPVRRASLYEIDSVALALSAAATSREALQAEQQALAARLRTVLESTTDSVVVLDRDWRVLYLNGHAQEQLGGAMAPLGQAPVEQTLVGRALPDIFPNGAHGVFFHAYRRALAEGTAQRVTAFNDSLGRWISADAYPSPEGLTIFFRDVSAERAAEAALRQNEALLKAVLDNVPVGVVLAEAGSGRMVLSNRRMAEILRPPAMLSSEIAYYGEDWECYHADGRPLEGMDTPLARALLTGLPAAGEYRGRRPDGSLGWVRISSSPIRDAQGQVTGAVAAIADIDAERRADGQLRESEQRFRTLAETIPQIVWSAQADGEVDYVNPRLQDFTGLPTSTALRMLDRLIHPADRRRTERAWRRARKLGEAFSAELRLLRADGGWRWCVARALPVRGPARPAVAASPGVAGGGVVGNATGNAIARPDAAAREGVRRWIGTVADVTDIVETREALARQVAAHAASRGAAVRAAAELAASESRFRRFAEASPDVMWMTDARGSAPEFVSPAFERIWGLAPETMLAAPHLWFDAVHPADKERVLGAWEAAQDGGTFDTEYRINRPDGGLRWIRDVGFPILDAQGGSTRRGGLTRDITAAKAAEARQVLLLGELNHRVKNTLATVHSLALQTARTAGENSDVLQRFLADFQARLLALSRGHDLLTARTWRGATLEETARAALAPWQVLPGQAVDETRLQVSGPAAWLAPKQALGLALALHELATNAAKHGALSGAAGRILVSWRNDEDGTVELLWQEQDGPPVLPPSRRGFGSRMLERGLPVELGAGSSVVLDYASSGFAATIRFRPVNGPQADEEIL